MSKIRCLWGRLALEEIFVGGWLRNKQKNVTKRAGIKMEISGFVRRLKSVSELVCESMHEDNAQFGIVFFVCIGE